MALVQRFLTLLILCAVCTSFGDVQAQQWRPHEPFDSTKAQKLSLEPGAIIVGDEEHPFQFEVAASDRERSIGLMHRAELADDRGMLFDFKRDRMISMWMRNTFIPLDMLFLSKNGEVMTIIENTTSHSERSLSSRVRVRSVLELAAGTVQRLGIKPGDRVRHSIFGEQS